MSTESLRPSVLLRSEQSNGEVAIVESVMPAGSPGPPLHHHDFDEAFYVLDGELTFQLGEELSTAGPGTLTFAPRGTHHTLANLSSAEARYLLVCTPAGFERAKFGLRHTGRVGATPKKGPAMSIVVRFHPSNLTAELYDESHPKVEAAGFPPEGLDYHVAFGSPDNLTVSEIWDSREQFEAFGEKLMPVLTEAGIEFSGPPEVFEVHNLVKR
jgi:quercetin dioxygenase-like cupin family protein